MLEFNRPVSLDPLALQDPLDRLDALDPLELQEELEKAANLERLDLQDLLETLESPAEMVDLAPKARKETLDHQALVTTAHPHDWLLDIRKFFDQKTGWPLFLYSLVTRFWFGSDQILVWFRSNSGLVQNRLWFGLDQTLAWFRSDSGLSSRIFARFLCFCKFTFSIHY